MKNISVYLDLLLHSYILTYMQFISTTTYDDTATVQRFIRTLAGAVSLILLIFILVLPASALSTATFDNPFIFGLPALLLGFWVASVVSKMFYILPEWQKLVLLRLGKFVGVRGAGFFIIPPFIFSVASIVDMRIVTQQVEATATLTKDNVPIKVTAAIEYKVEDPRKAVIDVQNYRTSVTWLSTEALKNTIGSLDLKELLSEREQIAESLRKQIDEGAASYGVDVKAVRITDVDTPQSLIEELAVIARARRASEAKQIQAAAEVQVAQKMVEASRLLNTSSSGMKLRELQVLSEMSKEESSMIIVYPYGDVDGKSLAQASAGNISMTKHKDTQEKIEESSGEISIPTQYN